MNDLDKVYDYVCKMEDFHYNQLTDDFVKNLMPIAKASAFQQVRYFIEIMREESNENNQS